MSITDPIADMFTVIRNAYKAKKETLEVPSSKLKLQILEVLKKEGYIKNFKNIKDTVQGSIKVYLRFKKDQTPVLTCIKRVSKPGLRIYVPQEKIPRVLGKMGIAILSTSSGILTNKEARKLKVGGEVLCYVW